MAGNKNNKFFRKNVYKVIFLVLFFITLEIIVLLFFNKSVFYPNSSTIDDYVKQIISECSNRNYKTGCYDKEIPKLMDKISMVEAFKVVDKVQVVDKSYKYCHVVGHALSTQEINKDPSRWKEVISSCSVVTCQNGCLHGSIIARFKKEYLDEKTINSLTNELRNICKPKAARGLLNFTTLTCYHSIGHLLMYMSNANVEKSIKLCKEIVNNNIEQYINSCVKGVFMQIFQPLDPEDIKLVKNVLPKKENINAFCNKYKVDSQYCFQEAWPLFWEEIQKPDGMIKYCSYSDDFEEQTKCYYSLVGHIAVYLSQRQKVSEEIYSYCSLLPEVQRISCFNSSARKMISVDPMHIDHSIDICKISSREGLEDTCFKDLINYSRDVFVDGSREKEQFCNLMPDKWGKICHE